jgi:hypothetical protein
MKLCGASVSDAFYAVNPAPDGSVIHVALTRIQSL